MERMPNDYYKQNKFSKKMRVKKIHHRFYKDEYKKHGFSSAQSMLEKTIEKSPEYQEWLREREGEGESQNE